MGQSISFGFSFRPVSANYVSWIQFGKTKIYASKKDLKIPKKNLEKS